MTDFVILGKFGRPHGVKGEVRLFLYNAASDLELAGLTLRTEDDSLRAKIESVRAADKFLITRIAGISSRSEAERLTNVEVGVSRAELPELADDEFYLVDVIGFDVLCAPTTGADAEAIGKVSAFLDGTTTDVMSVEGPPLRRRLLVPFLDHIIAGIDFEQGQILLAPFDEWAPEDDVLDLDS